MLLTPAELPTYYAPAAEMLAQDVGKYLQQANAYCLGYIGGIPPVLDWDPDQLNLKGIVALAFEILAEGETAQTDPTSGNITEVAPTGAGKRTDPLKTVDKMLLPYRAAFGAGSGASTSDDGFMFLGGR